VLVNQLDMSYMFYKHGIIVLKTKCICMKDIWTCKPPSYITSQFLKVPEVYECMELFYVYIANLNNTFVSVLLKGNSVPFFTFVA